MAGYKQTNIALNYLSVISTMRSIRIGERRTRLFGEVRIDIRIDPGRIGMIG
jgi:hypothetical protein